MSYLTLEFLKALHNCFIRAKTASSAEETMSQRLDYGG